MNKQYDWIDGTYTREGKRLPIDEVIDDLNELAELRVNIDRLISAGDRAVDEICRLTKLDQENRAIIENMAYKLDKCWLVLDSMVGCSSDEMFSPIDTMSEDRRDMVYEAIELLQNL